MKTKRQFKILEIINENSVETQEDLAERLKNAGFAVTQATVSRDIRELKLTKVSDENGGQKYAVMSNDALIISERFIRVFKDGVVSMNFAQNIIVIKTLTGMAMAVAAALDSMSNSEIIGSIAGDDTIFCVVKSEKHAVRLIERLKLIIKEQNND